MHTEFTFDELEKLDYSFTNFFKLRLVDYYKHGQTCDELIEAVRQGIKKQKVEEPYVAIDYLQEHDNSLKEAVKIADKSGYKLKDINSELLATLIYQDRLSYNFSRIIKDIREIFNEAEDLATRIEEAEQLEFEKEKKARKE